MGRVRDRIGDRRVLALVKAFLKAGILTELGVNEDTNTGTPQGGILSPPTQEAIWARVGCRGRDRVPDHDAVGCDEDLTDNGAQHALAVGDVGAVDAGAQTGEEGVEVLRELEVGLGVDQSGVERVELRKTEATIR